MKLSVHDFLRGSAFAKLFEDRVRDAVAESVAIAGTARDERL
jgi:hypothetical protein